MNSLAGPEAFRTVYRLSGSDPDRLTFVLPRERLFLIGLTALLTGLVFLLFPRLFETQPFFMVLFAGWGCVLAAAALFWLVLSRRGVLVLDGRTRNVRLEFRSPREHTVWTRPFADFATVRTRQVKDLHGLHNHWRIEIVTDDGVCLRVGYGLSGALRRKARDRLSSMVARLLEVPVEHRDG